MNAFLKRRTWILFWPYENVNISYYSNFMYINGCNDRKSTRRNIRHIFVQLHIQNIYKILIYSNACYIVLLVLCVNWFTERWLYSVSWSLQTFDKTSFVVVCSNLQIRDTFVGFTHICSVNKQFTFIKNENVLQCIMCRVLK